MTLKECYGIIGGDYENVVGRLMSERIVQKFVLRFPDDPSYEMLFDSLKKENYEEAFRAAHTIKGVCQNLGFTTLGESSSRLTEALRAGRKEEYQELAAVVEEDYQKTVSAIKMFREEIK